MKRLFQILLWKLPKPYITIFCAIGGGLLCLAGFYTAFIGKGGPALLFLLLGLVGMCSLLANKKTMSVLSQKLGDYEIIDTDAGNIGGCNVCRYKDADNLGYRRKVNWLKKRYAEGLRYKVLCSREFGEIGMIEYAPGNYTWRPVEAAGYLVIHCLMVSGKHTGKGLGSLLLESCLNDAKKSKCRGVAVVTSSESPEWRKASLIAQRDLFVKAGFVSVESAPPYELLVKKLNKTAPNPRFIVQRERLLKRHKKGLTILAADQCPFVPKWVEEIADVSRKLGLKPKVVRIRSAKASRELPTPYGMFSILYEGKLIADHPISARRFISIMRNWSIDAVVYWRRWRRRRVVEI